jgi:hypothetical protein
LVKLGLEGIVSKRRRKAKTFEFCLARQICQAADFAMNTGGRLVA